MVKQVGYRVMFTLCRFRRYLFLFLIIAVGYAPAFCQGLYPILSGPETQSGKPKLSILRPTPGQAFWRTESIVVDIAVDNFELVPPAPQFWGPTKKPVGHVHIYLDSNPLIATSSRRIMFGTNANAEPMPAGWHRLVVELVDEDHNVLSPRLYQQVQFYTADNHDHHVNEEVDAAGFSGFVK